MRRLPVRNDEVLALGTSDESQGDIEHPAAKLPTDTLAVKLDAGHCSGDNGGS